MEYINHVSSVNISPTIIEQSLLKLDKSKGAGSDGIPPIFWSNCAKSLCFPLHIIFTRSLHEGIVPNIWKEAHIIPIYKKGTKTNITNYRGISILNTVSKVLEKLVYNAIYPTISQGIPEMQHGFLRNRSTTTNLACFVNFLTSSIDGGGQVDVVYTDFEKAFDRVDHAILLRKLYSLGIHGSLFRWITSYLSNRSQAVTLGGYKSDFISISSGVPQGSHLGPLFYNAYLYDITYCFANSQYLMYADDKKIFYRIRSMNDCHRLQRDLDSLYEYYCRNNINVNIGKCQIISFSRKPRPIMYNYNFNNTNIQRAELVRDLGVYLDAKLTMIDHIDNVTGRAFRNLGFVIRSCKPFKNSSTIKSLYFAYVRSVLEYGCQIWSPNYIIHKSKIEKIQRTLIKHLNFRSYATNVSYLEACRKNKLLSLEERRTLLDMLLLYDILHGRVDCPELVGGIFYNVPRRRTRHTQLLHVSSHSTNYASNSVLARITRTYNKLFKNIDPFSCTKGSFKSAVICEIVNT